MDKQQLLLEVRQMLQSGQISQAEIMSAMSGLEASQSESISHSMKLSEIMYYIGGGIVFLGLGVLVSQNWEAMSSALRVVVTLGSAIAAFVTAVLFYTREDFRKVSNAFFMLSGILAPFGLNIAFHEWGFDLSQDIVQFSIFMILTVLFLGSVKFFKQSILLFLGVVFASIWFHFVINLIVGQNLLSEDSDKLMQYRILVDGIAWILLGYYLKQTSFKALTGVLYGFGVFGFLAAAMALGGWSPMQNVFWELVYPLLVFGVIFLSVYLKSKSFLVFGTIFLIGYILKITGEYFTSGMGWPTALVFAGLAIMGVGYWAVRLNKKYFGHTV